MTGEQPRGTFNPNENLRTVQNWERVEGAPSPLGATWNAPHQAWNFALYSRHATGVTVLLYTDRDHARPVYQYRFSPLPNKTGRIWHCWVPASAAPEAKYYAYRVEGPDNPAAGFRFDASKVLFDPYAPELFFPPGYSRAAAARRGPNDGLAPLGVLPGRRARYNWEGDQRPRHTHDAVIYELHVRGFTARANSGVRPDRRGTFAGLVEKIPYLKELGVTVVELMPIHQYDPQEGNYWGYMTMHFMSPHQGYASDPARAIDEFRDLVKAFHGAGIEVVLDVVYNHTSEGNWDGPTYSYRGIDNGSYYLLQADRRQYINDTGCGNTLRCANAAVRALILRSLQFWSEDMHVDGFRFDLASIFTRNTDGSINLDDPPLIAEIGHYARNADVRLIAEAWDISTYQLGRNFPGLSWLQWNGKYRDDARAFTRSDPGQVAALMQRLYGSDDLFPDALHDACRPYQSVNFVTAHDGFCLYDLVSYNLKHNLANGNANTDGSDHNLSWNCGWEGDDGAPDGVLALRRRQVKNFCCLLMLANGTPMFVAGDEFMHTQGGNNNPYNQDNEIAWLDWDRLESNRDIFRFFKAMIAFRKAHPSLGRSRYWRDDVSWHGVEGGPDLSFDSRALAFCLRGAPVGDVDLYVMINAYWEDLVFHIQAGEPGAWRRAVDTGLPSPDDIAEPGQETRVRGTEYAVKARSVVVLQTREKTA